MRPAVTGLNENKNARKTELELLILKTLLDSKYMDIEAIGSRDNNHTFSAIPGFPNINTKPIAEFILTLLLLLNVF